LGTRSKLDEVIKLLLRFVIERVFKLKPFQWLIKSKLYL